MTSFTDLVQTSGAYGWLFAPSAILLGALHGLEPGHSKTMMAAFIVAIRGTVSQAVLLAVTATISHTAIVWIFALLALTYGEQWGLEANEPYFQIVSGLLIIGIAAWILFTTVRDRRATQLSHDHNHDETKAIDTGHGMLELSIFEEGLPPRFRIRFKDYHGTVHAPSAKQTVTVETLRADGSRQLFEFESRGEFLEATAMLPEPHEFTATIVMKHGGHAHEHALEFEEHHHHHHDEHEHHDDDHAHDGHHHHGERRAEAAYQDAHERAHAREIERRFADRRVTTGQVALFGLTGGLIPCSAAIAVLLLCLQLQKFWLGVALVLCFSIGLALTLLASGVTAAWGMRHATQRWRGLDAFMQRAPYISSAVIICIGAYVIVQGAPAA